MDELRAKKALAQIIDAAPDLEPFIDTVTVTEGDEPTIVEDIEELDDDDFEDDDDDCGCCWGCGESCTECECPESEGVDE